CPRLQLHEVAVTRGWRVELFVEPCVELVFKGGGVEAQNAIGLRDGWPEGRLFEEARGVGESATGTTTAATGATINYEEPSANLAARIIGGVDVGVQLSALQRIDQTLSRQPTGRMEVPQEIHYRAERHIQVQNYSCVIAWRGRRVKMGRRLRSAQTCPVQIDQRRCSVGRNNDGRGSCR